MYGDVVVAIVTVDVCTGHGYYCAGQGGIRSSYQRTVPHSNA